MNAGGSHAFQDGNPDVAFRDLQVDVPRHAALTEEFDAVQFRLGAAGTA
jgi:hypothetical protein